MRIVDSSGIEEMRQVLINTFNKHDCNLLHPDVVSISQKLDELTIKTMLEQYASNTKTLSTL
jgi:hypothetical protein